MDNINNSSEIVELKSYLLVAQDSLDDTQKKQEAAQAALLAQIQANLANTGSTLLTTSDTNNSTLGASAPAPTGPDNYSADYNALESALFAMQQGSGGYATALAAFSNALQKIEQDFGGYSPAEQQNIATALNTAITDTNPSDPNNGSTFGSQFINDLLLNLLATSSGSSNMQAQADNLLKGLTTFMNSLASLVPSGGMVSDFQAALNKLSQVQADGKTYFDDVWLPANTTMSGGNLYLFWQYAGVQYLVYPAGTTPPSGNVIDSDTYMQIQLGSTANFMQNSNIGNLYQQMINTQIASIMNGPPGVRLIMMMMLLNTLGDDQQSKIGGLANVGNGIQTAGDLISQITADLSSSGNMTATQAQQMFQSLSFLKAIADNTNTFGSQSSSVDANIASFNLPAFDSKGNPVYGPDGKTQLTMGQLYAECANGTQSYSALADAMNHYSPANPAPTPPNPTPGPTPNPNAPIWQTWVQNVSALGQKNASQSSVLLQEETQAQQVINTYQGLIQKGFTSYNDGNNYYVQKQIAG
jgi:hypothetical protein